MNHQMFFIVFYSKTIAKQKKLSHYVNPDVSRPETWHKAFSYRVDSNPISSLETYFKNFKVTRYRSCDPDRNSVRKHLFVM